MFEASNCNAEALSESARISACIRRIAESTNSFVLNEPIIVPRKIGVIGITGALVTQSSHIIVHTFLDSKEASLDVYSYHPLNLTHIKELFAQHFGTNTNFVTDESARDINSIQSNNHFQNNIPSSNNFLNNNFQNNIQSSNAQNNIRKSPSVSATSSFGHHETQKLQPHDHEEAECKEPGCSKKATKVWGGRAVCNDHYDYHRDKEDQIKHLYPFE
ncbi:S-adenosylmethionine decarboxylase [Candidatus Woesearchaeota archaeon]|nr:S-adenosylmethionine decarboxylase [Candidatus Woesearchaeota archaeon]